MRLASSASLSSSLIRWSTPGASVSLKTKSRTRKPTRLSYNLKLMNSRCCATLTLSSILVTYSSLLAKSVRERHPCCTQSWMRQSKSLARTKQVAKWPMLNKSHSFSLRLLRTTSALDLSTQSVDSARLFKPLSLKATYLSSPTVGKLSSVKEESISRVGRRLGSV